jgi:hypothetical protein
MLPEKDMKYISAGGYIASVFGRQGLQKVWEITVRVKKVSSVVNRPPKIFQHPLSLRNNPHR